MKCVSVQLVVKVSYEDFREGERESGQGIQTRMLYTLTFGFNWYCQTKGMYMIKYCRSACVVVFVYAWELAPFARGCYLPMGE